jgi:hypothetical protein
MTGAVTALAITGGDGGRNSSSMMLALVRQTPAVSEAIFLRIYVRIRLASVGARRPLQTPSALVLAMRSS